MEAASSGVSFVIAFTIQPCSKPPLEAGTAMSQSSGLQATSSPWMRLMSRAEGHVSPLQALARSSL